VSPDDAPPTTDLSARPLPTDVVGLLEGLTSTRAIRRYTDEPVPEEALRTILFAATRAPTGSNRQQFRFIVLTDGPKALEAKKLIAGAAQKAWGYKRANDRYDEGSGAAENTPKARMAATMQAYADHFEQIPVVILPCLIRYREANSFEGASIYPSCQNILLAARAIGYGGVLNGFHALVEPELRALLGVPDEVFMAATITLGKPCGSHGPVRRRPMSELVFADHWGEEAPWAADPPGTTYTSAGPPKQVVPGGVPPSDSTQKGN
jgi:nitroreductase